MACLRKQQRADGFKQQQKINKFTVQHAQLHLGGQVRLSGYSAQNMKQ
jgi:hypothetical protein